MAEDTNDTSELGSNEVYHLSFGSMYEDKYTTDPEVAQQWLDDGYSVYRITDCEGSVLADHRDVETLYDESIVDKPTDLRPDAGKLFVAGFATESGAEEEVRNRDAFMTTPRQLTDGTFAVSEQPFRDSLYSHTVTDLADSERVAVLDAVEKQRVKEYLNDQFDAGVINDNVYGAELYVYIGSGPEVPNFDLPKGWDSEVVGDERGIVFE